MSWFAEAMNPPEPPDFAEIAKLRTEFYPKSLEQIHGAPIGWFPTHPSNPSKLVAHKFVDGEWIALPYAKFVSWPEKFPG